MNFLGHLYFAQADPQSVIGNVGADFVKGRATLQALPPGIRRGIALHRLVDRLTDEDPEVTRLAALFRSRWRHLGRVFVDLFFDHFLVRGWEDFHGEPLRRFLDHRYDIMVTHAPLLGVPRFVRFAANVRAEDRFGNYGDLAHVGRVLAQLEGRRSWPGVAPLREAAALVEEHYGDFAETFARFLPRLGAALARHSGPELAPRFTVGPLTGRVPPSSPSQSEPAMISQQTLPDIQKTRDGRGIAIDEVGVTNIRYPLTFPLRDGGTFHTVANISMRVSLPHSEKGTHMSRFMIALEEKVGELSPGNVSKVLEHLLDLLNADRAYLDMDFPIFLKRPAPVTGIPGLLDYDCSYRGVMTRDGSYAKEVGVVVNAASLCPCSKEISQYGAHNQRSRITIKIREADQIIWFEDLVEIAERNASCQLYPILKRPDEKHVTERAYNNPKFVEDIVRDVSADLIKMLESETIRWFYVSSNNYESIHNHDAFAKIERGNPGDLLRSSAMN